MQETRKTVGDGSADGPQALECYEEILANETKNNLMELKKMQLDLLEKRANDEVKLYVSNKVCVNEYNLTNW